MPQFVFGESLNELTADFLVEMCRRSECVEENIKRGFVLRSPHELSNLPKDK